MFEQLILWCAHASNKDTDAVEDKTGLACVVEGVQWGVGCVFRILKYKKIVRICCTQEKLQSIFRFN